MANDSGAPVHTNVSSDAGQPGLQLPPHHELKAQARERGISTRRWREQLLAKLQSGQKTETSVSSQDSTETAAIQARRSGSVIDLRTRANAFTQQIGKISKPSRHLLKHWVGMTAILAIAVPTALASVYYGAIASDQFVTQSQFSVRSGDGSTAPDIMGMFTGFSSGASSTTGDSFILLQYIHSREMVEELERSVNLRELLSSQQADWFSRFRKDATIEELVSYWTSMSDVKYEPASGILTIDVRAFNAADSQKIGAAVLETSERLINNLSRRAREDGLRYAREELSRSELRLKFARQQIRDFRDRERSLDPSKTAESRLGILSKLEGDLASAEAELAGVSGFLNSEAPSVRVLTTRIAAIKKQIQEERGKLGGVGDNSSGTKVLSGVISEYEELAVEREFAEKAYVASLASLERSRMEIERQSRYVTTFVKPRLADEALYPLRLQSILVVLLVSSILWCLGILLVYAVRDHTM
jgi:capsular polysaccharide transport system permease protein